MKLINPNKITDLQMFSIKNQAKLAQTLQKIGKGKRKVEISLSKSSQKYLDQIVDELKKQMATSNNDIPNISEFLNYLKKNVHFEKGQKRPKTLKLNISYDEQDFLILQIKSMITELEKQKLNLKWYNLIKKLLFSSMKTQNELLLKDIKNR